MEPKEIFDETSVRRLNAEYLWKISNVLSSSCPAASRFYLSNLERRLNEKPDLLKDSAKKSHDNYCHHCGSLWDMSKNCKVRVHPHPRPNQHIKKLLKIEATEHWKLNSNQRQKLKRFRNSTSKLVYKCFVCNKTTSYPGTKTMKTSVNTPSKTSTPVPKLKIKKRDLTAGLYIPSPSSFNSSEKSSLEESNISGKTNLLEETPNTSIDPLNTSKISQENKNTSLKKEMTLAKTEVSSKSSSQKKSSINKKKTLLAQILSQEQSKKKKTSLSSFLVSL